MVVFLSVVKMKKRGWGCSRVVGKINSPAKPPPKSCRAGLSWQCRYNPGGRPAGSKLFGFLATNLARPKRVGLGQSPAAAGEAVIGPL
jgi:hypothetical protein